MHRFLFLFAVAHLLLAQPVTLDGSAVDSESGAPVANRRVKLTGAKSGDLFTVTDATGQFHFTAQGGRYTVLVDRPGLSPASARADLTTGPMQLKIPVTPGGIITGFITDPNGLAVEFGQVRVQILTRERGGRPVPVDSPMPDDRGQYRSTPLEPGTYYVAVPYSDSSGSFFVNRTWHTVYFPHAPDIDSAAPIPLAPGQEFRADLQYVEVAGVRLTGSLRVDPPPPTGAYVQVYLQKQGGSAMLPQFFPAAGGEYTIPNVEPGSYTVMAAIPEAGAATWKPVFGAFERVTVEEQDIRLDLHLQPLKDLRGMVAFNDGCTPARVRIAAGGVGVLTAPDGSFSLSGLRPGPTGISATPANGDPTVSTASIRVGDRAIHPAETFDYPPSQPVEVRVTMQCTGRPK